jgi:hypothetical protein
MRSKACAFVITGSLGGAGKGDGVRSTSVAAAANVARLWWATASARSGPVNLANPPGTTSMESSASSLFLTNAARARSNRLRLVSSSSSLSAST